MPSKCNSSKRRRRVAQLFCYLCMVPASSSFTTSTRTCTFRAIHQPARPSSALSERNQGDKKPKGRRFTQTVHQQSNYSQKEFDADRMWRNSRSIEELENRLTSRWGTDLSKWTAQDVDDGSENEDEWFDDPTTEVAGETTVFRARPVGDPWADEGGGASSSTKQHRTSFLSLDDDDDTSTRLARRAQRNQERLAKRKDVQPNEDDDESDFDNNDVPSRKQNKKRSNDLQVDDLISSRPVGGQGTFQKADDCSPQQTFFFSPGAQAQSTEDSGANEQEQPKSNRERTPGIPILDEDGNPLLLTLAQAENDFKDLLVAEYDLVEDEISDEDRLHSLSRSDEAKGWEDLGIISPILLENLEVMGCEQPLNVQQKTCPSALEGEDFLVGTYTGSGKTLAFLVPLIQRLVNEGNQDGSLKVLIVAPGRELASQIVSVTRELLEGTNFSVMMAIGGTTFTRNLEQIRKRKPDILVGTPGRIAELVVGRPGERGGRLKIGKIQSLVLDEFDALLEYKPHRDPTSAIIQCLKQRHGDRLQSILCSATASDMLGSSKLEKYLRNDYSLAMAEEDDLLVTSATDGGSGKNAKVTRVSRTVVHGVVHVPHRRFALETLRRILHTDPMPQQILIFAENSRKVDIVVEKLEQMGIVAAPLHGGRGSDKQDRAEVSKALREGYVGIVVATELAARGLDAPLLTHVINLDLPTDASHYAHRAGRCGRGGRPGVVINITTSPRERNVPRKFADKLGINLYTVEPRNGRLNIVDPGSVDLD